jgi:hypothetical protein
MPSTRHLLKPERRRALEVLAPCRDGCTETTMLAHGFSIDMMVELINSGLATVQTEWFVAGGYQGERARVSITEAGRRALSEQLAARGWKNDDLLLKRTSGSHGLANGLTGAMMCWRRDRGTHGER